MLYIPLTLEEWTAVNIKCVHKQKENALFKKFVCVRKCPEGAVEVFVYTLCPVNEKGDNYVIFLPRQTRTAKLVLPIYGKQSSKPAMKKHKKIVEKLWMCKHVKVQKQNNMPCLL